MNQQDAPGLKNDCPEQLLDARHEGTSSWGRAEQTPLNSAMFPRYNILASGGLEMVTSRSHRQKHVLCIAASQERLDQKKASPPLAPTPI
jgi:hypothetical protein